MRIIGVEEICVNVANCRTSNDQQHKNSVIHVQIKSDKTSGSHQRSG